MASPLQVVDTDNARAPKNNPAVSAIMEERGVGRKRAYAILKTERAATFTGEVPNTQRVQVLMYLVEHDQTLSAAMLLDGLHANGMSIDMHDVVKTLWSLQKNRFVHFRERGNGVLFAIKVTDAGLAAYAGMREKLSTPAPFTGNHAVFVDPSTLLVHDPVADVAPLRLQHAEPLYTEDDPDWAAIVSPVVNTTMHGEPPIARPWVMGNLGGWPAFRDLRDRAVKADKLAAAAKLLEEVGEDDIALSLMAMTEFTPLEGEVIEVLKLFKEL